MIERSKPNIAEQAVNFANSPGKGQLPTTSTTNQRGKYNVAIDEAQSTHIGDVYNNYYTSPTTDQIPEGVEKTESENFPYSKMHITEEPPEQIAVLYVYENGDNKYSIWGGHAFQTLEPCQAREKPNLSLKQLVQEIPSHERNQNIRKILHGMLRFSKINASLGQWLRDLRGKVGADLCLVIADYTNYEIPWEMVSLSPNQSPYDYLGALMTTVRWRDVILDEGNLKLEFEQNLCTGTAITYEAASPESVLWSGIKVIPYQDIKQFQIRLQQEETDCGFIYMAGSGRISEDGRDMILGSEIDESQRITLGELQFEQLKLIQQSRSLVFINANYSGLNLEDPDIPGSYTWGWVEFFLSKGARGVIGTLGIVEKRYAAEFVHHLIRASQDSPNLSVAASIRSWRSKFTKKLKDSCDSLSEEEKIQYLEQLIYSFMYIYYGNPMTILQLMPARG